MPYFQYFQPVSYALPEGPAGTVMTRTVCPIVERLTLADLLQDDPGVFFQYRIQEHERPDHVAQNVYGNVSYVWLVMLANDITLADWPLSDEQFAQLMIATYGSLQAAMNTTVAWFDGNGFQINQETWNALSDPAKSTQTAYQVEFARNDNRRTLQLVLPALAPSLDARLKNLMLT